jgi:hypothetical protein
MHQFRFAVAVGMRSRRMKSVIFLIAFVLFSASGADAAKKHKRPAGVSSEAAASAQASCRGSNVFHCGPIYNAYDYLGNDPDPFIRAMIQRDLGAKYGGAE